MIQGLRSLEGEISTPNAASLSANFKRFSAGFESTDVRHLTSFHALTTVFELFALYLMFRVCRTGFVIPWSCIYMHLHWFAENQQSLSLEAAPDSSIHIYRRCLMDLTRAFARMISQLDSFVPSAIRRRFSLGIRIYPSRLLHRRNVELLSIAIVNLRATGVDLPNVTGAWTEISKVNKIKLLFDPRGLPPNRSSKFVFSVPITFDTGPFHNSSRNWSSHMVSTRVKTPSSSSRLLQDTTISKACCRNLGYKLSRLEEFFPLSPNHEILRRLSLTSGQQRNTTRAISRRCARFSGSGDMYTLKSERSGSL